MLDSLSIGVRAALQSTVIPKLTVTGEGEEMEIEVSDNPSDSTPIDASLTPVIVTLNQVRVSSTITGLFSLLDWQYTCTNIIIYAISICNVTDWWTVCGRL